MEKEEVIKQLKLLQNSGDTEYAHAEADNLLLLFLKELGHEDVVEEFIKIDKWYA